MVFLTHVIHESVLDRFRRLERETGPRADVYLFFDATAATTEERQRARTVAGDRLHTFVQSRVTDTDYPDPWADPARPEVVPGNVDLLYLHVSRTLPDYSRYWFVEYDVDYTGTWSEFFEAFESSTAELVGTTIRSYEDPPDWYWWPAFDPSPDVDRTEWRRGFFPVVRLSETILELVDEAYRAGWSGHSEAVLPTLAAYHDLDMEDVGGEGAYVSAGNENRFYTNTPERRTLSPGTFVYRPARSRAGIRSGKLYHPIKPDRNYVRFLAARFKEWTARQLPDR